MAKFYDISPITPKKFAEIHYREFVGVNKLLEKYLGKLKPLSILDIGCGHLAIQTLIRHNFGQHIVGIDLIPPAEIRKNLERLLSVIGHPDLHDKKCEEESPGEVDYFKFMRELCPFPVSDMGLDIREMDITSLQFPDRTFDAVISFSTFEHVLDVPKALKELKRVLKDDGLALIGIHLFPSLSGGHYPEWSDVSSCIPEDVQPWDHLRNPPAYTIKSEVLNTHRESEYLEMFQEEFEILEKLQDYEPGGRDLLTENIRKELVDYSEEELFKRVIVLVIKKPHKTVYK